MFIMLTSVPLTNPEAPDSQVRVNISAIGYYGGSYNPETGYVDYTLVGTDAGKFYVRETSEQIDALIKQSRSRDFN